MDCNKECPLSPSELRVLALTCQGRTSRQIAEALFVSRRTVEFHLDRIYKKLKVHNRVQALNRAREIGLI